MGQSSDMFRNDFRISMPPACPPVDTYVLCYKIAALNIILFPFFEQRLRRRSKRGRDVIEGRSDVATNVDPSTGQAGGIRRSKRGRVACRKRQRRAWFAALPRPSFLRACHPDRRCPSSKRGRRSRANRGSCRQQSRAASGRRRRFAWGRTVRGLRSEGGAVASETTTKAKVDAAKIGPPASCPGTSISFAPHPESGTRGPRRLPRWRCRPSRPPWSRASNKVRQRPAGRGWKNH